MGETIGSKKKGLAFFFLNITQFLGAFNDNAFKLLVAFFLIYEKGAGSASQILSILGGLFVLPFLLFSSAAGIFADRLSKRKIIVAMKIAEILLMGGALFFYFFPSDNIFYFLLFLLGIQATIFGPSKYGIIPEIVPIQEIPSANGTITSFTYIAIIIGTFLVSFLLDLTRNNFAFVFFFCLVVSIVGFLSSLFIKETLAQKSPKKPRLFFLSDIAQTLRIAFHNESLLPAMVGSAFFLFLGSFVQLNLIPFTTEALHMSEIKGGYLFLLSGIGIALGSFLAGRIVQKDKTLGLTCLCGFFLSLLFGLLFFLDHSLIGIAVFLILLGVTGGLFLIPCDSWIQVRSPVMKRGEIIATTNFLSFSGVLLSSGLLYLFAGVFHWSAAQGFLFMGIFSLLFSLILTLRLLPFFAFWLIRGVLRPFLLVEMTWVPEEPVIFFFQEKRGISALLLWVFIPNVHALFLGKTWLKRLISHCSFFSSQEQMVREARILFQQGKSSCLALNERERDLLKDLSLYLVEIQKRKGKRFPWVILQIRLSPISV